MKIWETRSTQDWGSNRTSSRSAFIRAALELALKQQAIAEMEKKHAEGYARHPVEPGEFDVWEDEQVWGGS